MGSVEKTEWVYCSRDYVQESKTYRNKTTETVEHPLRGTIVTTVKGSNVRDSSLKKSTPKEAPSKKEIPTDPLSIIASSSEFDGTDPLSLMARGDDAKPSFGRKKDV
eukprot:TCONS_00063087-protein